MQALRKSRLVFYVAMSMLRDGRAVCAKQAFDVWPQNLVPATLNSVKIAFVRMKKRSYTKCTKSKCVLTAEGMAFAEATSGPLNSLLEEKQAIFEKRHELEKVFLLWGQA